MSFGKQHENTNSTSQSTSNQSLDPTIMSWLGGNYAHAQDLANQPFQPFTGQRVADFNPAQTQAMGLFGDIANNNTGASTLDAARTAAQQTANYTPQQVTAPGYTAAGYTPTAVTAARAAAATPATAGQAQTTDINRGDIRDVNGGSLLGVDLSGYMNPYEQSVINGTTSDLERQRQQEQTYNQGRATAAHAFGGSRDALVAANTNNDFNRTIADQVAQLRYSGFTNAQGQAQTDLARQLQTSLANQGQDASVAGANAGAANSTSQFNAGQNTQTSLFNSGQETQNNEFNAGNEQQAGLATAAAANDAGQFNAGATNTANSQTAAQALQASLANQNAGLQGAALNSQGAGQLADMSHQEITDAIARAGALGNIGDAQQRQAQAILDAAYQQYGDARNWPLEMQQQLNAALGLAGNPTLTDSQSTGTQTGRSSGWNIGLGGGSSGGSSATQAASAGA